jgi:hypothetical protein
LSGGGVTLKKRYNEFRNSKLILYITTFEHSMAHVAIDLEGVNSRILAKVDQLWRLEKWCKYLIVLSNVFEGTRLNCQLINYKDLAEAKSGC